MESEQYTLVNATDKTVGGPFTRIDPSNEESKSALDLVVVSNGLLKYVDSLVIDKERLFTPARPFLSAKLITQIIILFSLRCQFHLVKQSN